MNCDNYQVVRGMEDEFVGCYSCINFRSHCDEPSCPECQGVDEQAVFYCSIDKHEI